jgi:beta-1,4-mannosyl-glycoprotein beta-1,4-N-acetylglucosaminyltransferase
MPADRADRPVNVGIWKMRASALAGVGRFAEAAEAARQFLARMPGGRTNSQQTRRFEATEFLVSKGEISAPSPRTDWRRYLEACLIVGAIASAKRAAWRLVCGERPTLFEDDADSVELLQLCLDLTGAELMTPILRDLQATYPDNDEIQALWLECNVRQALPSAAGLQLDNTDPAKTNRRLGLAIAARHLALQDDQGAIRMLAGLSVQRSKDREVLAHLARTIGGHIRSSSPTGYRTRSDNRKIINLLPFNNEVELLKIRMAEMASWVDEFVIVESAQTFTGNPKPLYFAHARETFAPYLDRIRHVVIEEFPDHVCAPWARDYYQRDFAVTALDGVWAEDDVLLITDADEIVRRSAADIFGQIGGELMGLLTTNHKFFFNYTQMADGAPSPLRSTTICRARVVRAMGVSYVRFFLTWLRRRQNVIPNAGWHFTSLNDAAAIAHKFRNYAHIEAARKPGNSLEGLQRIMAEIRAGQCEADWARQDLDESFPAYIRENRDALADFIL